MRILGLIKDGNPIVEYNDGEHGNLFDLGEPKDATFRSVLTVP